jgi:preprotein translocase subunit SecY
MKFFYSFNGENIRSETPLWLKYYFPSVYYIKILQRFLFTILSLFFIILVQTMVPIPGVDQNSLRPQLYSLSYNIDYENHRHFLSAHVFLLGLSPFVISNILVNVGAEFSEKHQFIKMKIRKVPFMGFAVNEFLMGKEEGKAGEGRLKRSIRWLGIPCMLLEALTYTSYLSRHTIPGARLDWPSSCIAIRFEIYSTLSLIGGACIVEKVANDIDENGLGNGSLSIICLEILIHFFHDAIHLLVFFFSDVSEHFKFIPLAITTLLTTFLLASWLNTVFDCIPLELYKITQVFEVNYEKNYSN